jgi:hypothetical protein
MLVQEIYGTVSARAGFDAEAFTVEDTFQPVPDNCFVIDD